MNIRKYRAIASATSADDQSLVVVRRDFSAGVNTRQHASKIGENQSETIENWDIGVAGETRKIKGLTLSADLSNNAGTSLFGFEPRGGTNELLVTHGQKLSGCTNPAASGTDSYTDHKSDFTTNLSTTIVKATCSGANGDVAIVSNGTDNVFQMLQDHAMGDLGDDNTDCPKTTVLTFYRNRLWALKDNLMYWSDALPSTYDGKFDRTTNNYNITVGAERALLGLRDMGLIAFGADAVYGINPSVTPAATDKPEKILDIGCSSGNTAVQVGDDVLFLAPDGVRGVFRTQQDKLQLGQSYPLSYTLKTEFENINWAQISKACAVYFDNKYFLALPTGTSTYNNQVWVYYPAQQAWVVITGWNVASFAKLKVGGEEQLFAVDSSDGSVYRAWYGNNNSGTAISADITGREEDCGQPLNHKWGGELEIEADAAGSGNSLAVSVAIDGGSFQALGTVDLTTAGAPTLPVALPFALADSYIIKKKFHLDGLGRWRTLQVKIENTDDNTDPIVLYGYNLVTFLEEYENE